MKTTKMMFDLTRPEALADILQAIGYTEERLEKTYNVRAFFVTRPLISDRKVAIKFEFMGLPGAKRPILFSSYYDIHKGESTIDTCELTQQLEYLLELLRSKNLIPPAGGESI